MKAVLVLCLIAAVLVSGADVESEKPTKTKAKTPKKAKLPVRTLSPKRFMPKANIVTVPKGDPRAYPPGLAPARVAVQPAIVPVPQAQPTPVPQQPQPQPQTAAPATATATTPFSGSMPVLRSTPTSAACAAQKGVCKATSSCTGNVVRGICSGASTITCCVPKSSTPSTPSTPTSNCPVYANAATSNIKGNGGVTYQVVRIAAEHFTGSADNTMTKPTACAFARMAAAAATAGIRLTISSGFRTYERQVYFWNCYQKKNCNNGNRAARPGTSNHGRGQALDINTGATSTKTYKWMAANAARFGFRRTVSDEPWHWEH